MALVAVLAIATVMLAIGDIVAGALLLRPIRVPARPQTARVSERQGQR